MQGAGLPNTATKAVKVESSIGRAVRIARPADKTTRTETGTMNATGRLAALTAAAVVVAGATAAGAASTSIMVNTSPSYGRHWMTVFTNTVDLSWDWSTNAAKARLDIQGMDGTTFTTNFTKAVSNYLWRVFPSDAPAAEDVYDLTLTFSTDASVVVGSLTSRLAVVAGAFGAAAVNTVSNSPVWSKVKANVVIPYDASFSGTVTNAVSTQLVIANEAGKAQTNAFADLSGYYGWKIKNGGWGYGTFDLTLTFPGATNMWTAELTRPLDGMMFKMR